jgi:hypothetical protein
MKLPMVKRLRAAGAEGGVDDGEGFALSAEIPGAGGKPLWRLTVELKSRPQGSGEHLQLRAHLQANFASTRAELAAQREGNEGLPAPRAAQWLLRSLERPALRRLAAPLLRRNVSSWLELHASTADLAGGPGALLPQAGQLDRFGIDAGKGTEPLAQTWAGQGGAANPGSARVSLLRFDKRHLPQSLAALLGKQPLQVAAAVVQVVNEEPGARRR